MPQKAQGADIPQLTGMRAVAAFMVYAFHNQSGLAPGTGPIALLVGQMHIGVNIFFVLSGFLIPWRYAALMAMKRDFWIPYARHRIARIYPLATLATVFWLGDSWCRDPKVWIKCLTLTKALFPGQQFIGVPQAWTLTVEECFYFAVPFLVIACRGRRLALWLPILTAIFWTAGLLIYGPTKFMVTYTIFGCCFEFFVGMMLAEFMAKITVTKKAGFRWRTPLGIGGIVVGMYALAACDQWKLPLADWAAVNLFFIPASVGLLFYGLVVENSFLAWLLATRPLIFLGKISYAFYLIHNSDFDGRFANLGLNLAVRFLLLLALAALLYLGIEEPMRRLIRGGKNPGFTAHIPPSALRG
jgi:peptidoglycan/LPS O-acetylase OafA/YrhL